MPNLVLRTLCDEYDSGLKMFYEELLAPLERGQRLLIRKEFADGVHEFYEGGKGEERLVRAQLADGTTAFYEGAQGGERQMRVEDADGKIIWTRHEMSGASRGPTAQHATAQQQTRLSELAIARAAASRGLRARENAEDGFLHDPSGPLHSSRRVVRPLAFDPETRAEDEYNAAGAGPQLSASQHALSDFIHAAAACGRSFPSSQSALMSA